MANSKSGAGSVQYEPHLNIPGSSDLLGLCQGLKCQLQEPSTG